MSAAEPVRAAGGPVEGVEPVDGGAPAAPVETVEPVEERLAWRLTDRTPGPHPVAQPAARALRVLARWDRAAYAAVAGTDVPALDAPLRRLSRFANHSKPWFLLATGLAVFGGPTGRTAARRGVLAIATTSLLVNQPMKRAGRRRRPHDMHDAVPEERRLPMPTSTSFPSGHSASAAAFAVAVGDVLPSLRLPLRAAAVTVAYSRVHTGVHYPGDVVAGVATGAVLGRLVTRRGERRAGG